MRVVIKPDLQRYLQRYALDLENFEVIEVLPQSRRFAAVILRDKRPEAYKPWCVQNRGGGHYFFSRKELDKYCAWRGWLR
ncbi:MAG: hypothetical protein DDT21_02449 [Syntrophomonadaceae bacterium]|nr:hypothetical protein [Bacillota bacterium]